MRRVVVREATITDVYRVAANLRPGDAAEVTGLGHDPKAAIRASFRHAIIARVALIDGVCAAIWGLSGAMISDEGCPWLMTTPLAATVPVAFVKIGTAQVTEMLALRRRLVNLVAADYRGACRFLELAGFTLDPPVPIGPKKMLFRRFWIER